MYLPKREERIGGESLIGRTKPFGRTNPLNGGPQRGKSAPQAPAPAKAGQPDPAKIAEAQRRAADDLRRRAAESPVIAEVITAAHARLGLWRLCAERVCRRGRGCRGDALACAARHWPVACSCIEEIAEARRLGEPGTAAGRHLADWSEKDGVLTLRRITLVAWRVNPEALPEPAPPAGSSGAPG
ncbi:MAG TPA: hypothetical protein VGF60_16100 [Xanthobacteraceae bacterium]